MYIWYVFECDVLIYTHLHVGQNPVACADEISTGLDAAVTYDISWWVEGGLNHAIDSIWQSHVSLTHDI